MATPGKEWQCPRCTSINQSSVQQCICGTKQCDVNEDKCTLRFREWLCRENKLKQYLSKFQESQCDDIRSIQDFTDDLLNNQVGISNQFHRRLLLRKAQKFKQHQDKFSNLLNTNDKLNEYDTILEENGILTLQQFKSQIQTKLDLQGMLQIRQESELNEIWNLFYPPNLEIIEAKQESDDIEILNVIRKDEPMVVNSDNIRNVPSNPKNSRKRPMNEDHISNGPPQKKPKRSLPHRPELSPKFATEYFQGRSIIDDRSNNIERKYEPREEIVRYTGDGHDILYRIGQEWADYDSRWASYDNPVDLGLIQYVSSDGRRNIATIDRTLRITNDQENYPWIIIDLKDVSVKLSTYLIGVIEKKMEIMPIKWKIEGTNDADYKNTKNWTLIQNETRSTIKKVKKRTSRRLSSKQWNKSDYDHSEIIYEIVNGDIGYFSKFRIQLTAPCYNQDNNDLSGDKILAMAKFELYGHAKRKAYKKERINEVKHNLQEFPAIPRDQYIGCSNTVLQMINSYEPLQHNECEEYKGVIPGLGIQLYDFQKCGVQWMLHREENGNKYGVHGGLLCDEIGLGKTVTTCTLMLSYLMSE